MGDPEMDDLRHFAHRLRGCSLGRGWLFGHAFSSLFGSIQLKDLICSPFTVVRLLELSETDWDCTGSEPAPKTCGFWWVFEWWEMPAEE